MKLHKYYSIVRVVVCNFEISMSVCQEEWSKKYTNSL